ncbi:unnamed protein product [Sphagnum balticum]
MGALKGNCFMTSALSKFLTLSLKISRRVVAVTVAVALLVGFVTSQSTFAADDVLMFKQRNVVTGHYTVYLSPHGLKLANEQQKSRVIASAPDWKLYMFNDASKKYFAVNPKDFKGVISAFVLSARGFNFSKVKFEKEKSYALNSVPVEQYKMIIDNNRQEVTPADLRRGEGENLNLTSGVALTLGKQIIPLDVIHAICRFYCLPEQDRFVLDLRARRFTRMSLMLSFSGLKKLPYDPSMFKHSVDGYTRGKSEYDVSVNVTEAVY